MRCGPAALSPCAARRGRPCNAPVLTGKMRSSASVAPSSNRARDGRGPLSVWWATGMKYFEATARLTARMLLEMLTPSTESETWGGYGGGGAGGKKGGG